MYNKVPTSASYIGTSWKMTTTATRFDTGTDRTMVVRATKLEKIRGSSKVLRHSCTMCSNGNNTKLRFMEIYVSFYLPGHESFFGHWQYLSAANHKKNEIRVAR